MKEAGGRVRERVFLRDAALCDVDPADGRNIEVVVTGLPHARGIPLAVDATVISPLHADGRAWRGAASKPGLSFGRARRSKETAYPELVGSSVLQLVVAAIEVGGRMCREARDLLVSAAEARAQCEPAVLRRQAARSWRARWTAMLSVAVQSAVATTLVQEGVALLDAPAGQVPLSVDVWLDGDGPHGALGAGPDVVDGDT